jgi:hypothetical protein
MPEMHKLKALNFLLFAFSFISLRCVAGATGILTTADCKKRAESIGAAAYIEVSAKSAATTNNGKAAVEEVFAKALHLATTPYVPKKKGDGCIIL